MILSLQLPNKIFEFKGTKLSKDRFTVSLCLSLLEEKLPLLVIKKTLKKPVET